MNIEDLKNYGIDVNDGLSRFMNNAAMYEKFLAKFSQNDTYPQLKQAIENNNPEEGFFHAHTLKGVCGNLSFSELLVPLNELVEYLRAGNIEDAPKLLEAVTEKYNLTKQGLELYFSQK